MGTTYYSLIEATKQLIMKSNKTNLLGKIDGVEIIEYTMVNNKSTTVKIMNYGATVTKLCCIDKNDKLADIILGFDNLDGYLQKDNPYMNCIVGRFANRINKAQYKHEGQTIQLASTNKDYVLHGGINGFDKKIWELVYQTDNCLIFAYTSIDGEEGYPGTLYVEVKYTLSDDDELHIEYTATTDKATVVNLTNHCYFNLSGGEESNVLNHELRVKAASITEVDKNSIPTGKFIEVEGTIFDLNEKKLIGEQFKNIDGYDHNWVVGEKVERPRFIASLHHELSGRVLEVYTTEPGVQVYSSNSFDGKLSHTKENKSYGKFAGICLETQLFPDSPNHLHFPTAFLLPDEEYRQHTIYKMKVVKE
jgi:aldose 1-epimerase